MFEGISRWPGRNLPPVHVRPRRPRQRPDQHQGVGRPATFHPPALVHKQA